MRMDPSRMRRTTWWAVIGYVLVASGLPLPGGVPPTGGDAAAKRLSAKDRSRPFPCMDKPCGCTTAEQCFTNCCCHTPAELLAWAQARRIEPAVIVALERRAAGPEGVASGGTVGRPTQAANCCSTAARPACCAETDRPACCSASAPVPVEPEAVPVAVRTVVLRAMLACGGIVSQWLTVGGSLPPPRVEFSLPSPFVEVCICGDYAADSISVAPALPPPRAA
jgi:hypothetical protein